MPDAAPSPDAPLTPLDRQQEEQLREDGRAWGATPAGGARTPASSTEEASEPAGGRGRRIRRAVLGPPIKSSAVVQERMRKVVALPVLSADALSSIAYGPEAILAVLVLAGGAGLAWSLPIGAAITCMVLAVGLSYRQTIRAYPHGGGSYIVATENLGEVPGLLAAAGLVTDYVLTVAISTAAGLDAVRSALPSLQLAVVPVGLGVILVLLLANLRGVRQSAALFAAPTYAFILVMLALVVTGLAGAAGHGLHAAPHPALHPAQGVGLVLVLRAFSSGATAMTGVEAISNAVPAFRPVEWRNARVTLSWMIALLVVLFAGIVVLAHLDGVVPAAHETVLSQLAHRHFGGGVLYGATQAATALVLLLAANTAFNDFPRVLYLLARDRFVARRYLRLGDRLAFSNGMIALAIAAGVLFAVFAGRTQTLIPVYAVGVFLAFTLSQAGMVVHWWRHRGPRWRASILFNGFGCACSALVLAIAAVTKLTEGAWVALLLVAVFTAACIGVRRHFDAVTAALAIGVSSASGGEGEETPRDIANLAIVLVPVLNRATLRALAYASSCSSAVVAVHVAPTDAEAERFRRYWAEWGDHLPLEVIASPYRAVVAPTVAYIEALHARRPDLTLTVVVPELVVRHWWERSLHDGDAARLRLALRPLSKVVVASVPFHV